MEEKSKMEVVLRERNEQRVEGLVTEDLSDIDIVNLVEQTENRSSALEIEQSNANISSKETEKMSLSSEKEELDAIELMVKGIVSDIVPENTQKPLCVEAPVEQGDRDLSLVFGAGASKLVDTPGNSGRSDSSMEQSVAGTSTPLRKRSRGRRRTRNSGRSSISSPSPVRPPDKLENKKLRFDEEEEGKDVKGDGNVSAEGSASNGELNDSGDWGSSFDGGWAQGGGGSSVGVVLAENEKGDTVTGTTSVEKDSVENLGP